MAGSKSTYIETCNAQHNKGLGNVFLLSKRTRQVVFKKVMLVNIFIYHLQFYVGLDFFCCNETCHEDDLEV